MKTKVQSYQYFLIDELYILEERRIATIQEKSAFSGCDIFEKFLSLEGELVAYDYFFGLIPTLALEYGIPPYIQTFKHNIHLLNRYHHKKKEKELISMYATYLAAVVDACKTQQKIAVKKYEVGVKEKNAMAIWLWNGVRSGYYGILLSMYNAALTTFKIPIQNFVSQADIENGDSLVYLDF